MIWKMMNFKRDIQDDVETFMRRTNTSITHIIDRHRITSWDILARRNIFKWGGWVARLEQYDPKRITLAILLDKNREWINLIAQNNNGRQLHGRYLHIWRWEALIYKYFEANFPGENWRDVAQIPERWHELVAQVH